MGGIKKLALAAGAAYVIFFFGGSYSFKYTHTCARSHSEESFDREGNYVGDVTVCDWYTANSKRWTFGDPVRSASAILGWEAGLFFSAVGLVITVSVVLDRRRERHGH